jgi:phosphatidylglycerophosphatase A
LKRVAWAIATWFGCGLVPLAPGTAGTLGAIPLYLLVAHTSGLAGVATAAALTTFVGVWAASVVARDLGKKDPQLVVVDEVAGFLITMLPARHLAVLPIAAGFVLFRLFDVVKPWPARALERLPSGWGIVMDDVAAGAFGACVMAGLQAARLFD